MKWHLVLTLFCLKFSPHVVGQSNCVKHWSKNKTEVVTLDSIFSKMQFRNLDTLYCDSFTVNSPFNYKQEIDFYTKQIGDYFSKASHVCFGMLRFKQSGVPYIGEVHTTQFVLDEKELDAFKTKYGTQSKEFKHYRIKVFTYYKYVVKGKSIYFVSTESAHLAKSLDSVFESLFYYIVQY